MPRLGLILFFSSLLGSVASFARYANFQLRLDFAGIRHGFCWCTLRARSTPWLTSDVDRLGSPISHHPATWNRKHTLIRRFAALTIACGWSLIADCHAVAAQPAEIVADSVSGFSGEQGATGWSYGYWDRTAYPDKSYNQTTDFQLFTHFGTDPINRLSGRPEFTTGKLWNLQDGKYYTSLWAEGGHPNGTMRLREYAQVEQWAVRRWVSTVNGAITISGHAGKVMPWGENWTGGCQALIVVDGKTMFSSSMDNRGRDYSITVTVGVGSRVDFLIGPGPSVGVTKFTGTIRTADLGLIRSDR